jgi:phospho-N-acetylmuramoyl-pentapeptide-transferase
LAYALTLGAVSFFISVIWGGTLIRLLRAYGVGKRIHDDGPESHSTKMGTPTMGGVMILGPVVAVTIALNLFGRLSMILPLGLAICCGVLGAVDDLSGLAGQRLGQAGLLARYKLLWLIVIAAVAAVGMYAFLGLRSVAIPALPQKIDLGLLYIPVAIFIIVATANSVNLTDGLDGLAGGTSAACFASYGIIAYLQGQAYLASFCLTVVGTLLAFLWYNAHPAQLFMGDTGSLALGAVLGGVALMTGQWLLLPAIGIILVAEAASVLLQVVYFKSTGGKRLFRMTPLHHHFELIGWSETQVTQRFWLVALLAAMLGIALALV